jgi:hypothetical protein
MLGFGGCPMSGYDLVGNLSTENLLHYFRSEEIPVTLDPVFYQEALIQATGIFPAR